MWYTKNQEGKRTHEKDSSGHRAWSPLANGVLTGKYHGEGKADGARMTNEGMKEFLPEEQRAARIPRR